MSVITFLHSYSPSPVLAQIGDIKIYWYGTLYLVSFVLAYVLVTQRLAQQRDDTQAQKLLAALPDFAFGLIVVGLIGARLYHVLNAWPYYWQHPQNIIAIWNGGLAVHGALIAGALYVWWYAGRHTYSFFWLTDLIVPIVLLGQAIGRVGNYFNQELYGQPTNLPWGIPIDLLHRVPGFEAFMYFHPTFLYESLWDILGFFFLLWIYKKFNHRFGITTATYLIVVGFGRSLTELLRIDTVPMIGNMRLPLFFAVALVLLGIMGLVFLFPKMGYTNTHSHPHA